MHQNKKLLKVRWISRVQCSHQRPVRLPWMSLRPMKRNQTPIRVHSGLKSRTWMFRLFKRLAQLRVLAKRSWTRLKQNRKPRRLPMSWSTNKVSKNSKVWISKATWPKKKKSDTKSKTDRSLATSRGPRNPWFTFAIGPATWWATWTQKASMTWWSNESTTWRSKTRRKNIRWKGLPLRKSILASAIEESLLLISKKRELLASKIKSQKRQFPKSTTTWKAESILESARTLKSTTICPLPCLCPLLPNLKRSNHLKEGFLETKRAETKPICKKRTQRRKWTSKLC